MSEENEDQKSRLYASTVQANAEADIRVAQAEANARIVQAEAKAKAASIMAEGEIKAAQQKAASKVAEEKSKRRSKAIGRVGRKLSIKVVVIIIGIIAVLAIVGAAAWQLSRPTEFINSSQISKIVAVEKLTVVNFAYEGVAEYTGDGHENSPLHIHYTAKAKATLNPADIKYDINNEAKTIMPILPEISISDPTINDDIDFLEGEAQNINIASVYSACKEDAASEIEAKSNIKDMAVLNARKAIEGLCMNLVSSKGYEIIWPEGTENGLQEQEGDNNAA